jgi:peptidyl-prolyl cis-trans isomerase SurA
MHNNRLIILASLLAAALIACSSGTSNAGDGKALSVLAQTNEVGGAKVIRKEPTVTQRGTFIRILVNNEPITNSEIQRRVKFRQLRRVKATTEEAEQELIDELLKMQEARARGTLASDGQVNQAFENFSKGNRTTAERMAAQLDQFGVGAAHFKQYIRAQMSWNRAVAGKFQSESSQSKALFELRKSGAAKPETTEYVLQQIIFVIPQDKRAALMKNRKAEALAFQQRYAGCDTAIGLAKQLRDVAIKELGRVMLPELPPNWSEDIQKTAVGSTTAPKETEKGVELIAVCKARVVSDDKAAQVVSQSQAFDKLEQEADTAADSYLAELRKSAVIIFK